MLLAEIISEMNRDELNIALALIHKRVCELSKGECQVCPWRGSDLCLPVRQYLRNEVSNDK